MLDLIIKDGKVVSPEAIMDIDIGIKDQKIVMIGYASDMPKAKRTIDANGKYVVPGGIDTHTHYDNPPFNGVKAVAGFYEGTRAAALGGTTSCIDFAIQGQYNTSLPMEIIELRLKSAEESVIDYGLHSSITKATPEAMAQIEEIINFGIPTFKCFTIYRKDGIMADDAVVLSTLEMTKKYNGMFGAHTENDAITDYNIKKALQEGHNEPIWHALTKPVLVEAEAINRMLYLANAADAAFFDFHLSCKDGLEMIKAQRNQGKPVYAETTTHYLSLTKDKLEGPDGINYICSPPLRSQEDVEALWKGIADGHVHTLGSDDVSFTNKQKLSMGTSFNVVPNGMPGSEFRMPIAFSEGVSKGRIDINKFVALTSANAAKIMGMYPQKGVIQVGSDADITIIDPEIEKVLSVEDSKLEVGWNPYEGMCVKGWPVVTVARGKVIVEDGEFKGTKGAGKFIKRKLHSDINSRLIV